jgi:hypothetical protein
VTLLPKVGLSMLHCEFRATRRQLMRGGCLGLRGFG